VAVVFLLFQGLTDRVNQAERSAQVAQNAAEALAGQVQRLGGNPVVKPSDLPEAVTGPIGIPGARGEPGSTGPRGLPGGTGPRGATGLQGDAGRAARNGTDGVGTPGLPGKDGTPVTGPAGKGGTDGKDGVDGKDSTVPGPPGPPGADSTVPGPQGAPGPTCPDGYTGEQLTVLTPQGGTRDVFACTANGAGP
jgi:hypothetical protein